MAAFVVFAFLAAFVLVYFLFCLIAPERLVNTLHQNGPKDWRAMLIGSVGAVVVVACL